MRDILIVGGGPAGLTAALYAARAGKTVTVFEKNVPGGQIVNSPRVDNYPGLPGMSGADFAEQLTAQVEDLGVELCYAEVLGAEKTGAGFRLDTDDGPREGRALILATGAAHRSLGLPGEEDLVGQGVSYCAVCDGAFFAGRQVAVVGGGDTALQDALFLSDLCEKVTLLVRRDRFRGEMARAELLRGRGNVEILFRHTVEGFETRDGAFAGLTVRSADTGETRFLPVDGVFLAVGQQPETAPFAALAETDPAGYLLAGEDTLTSAPGVFTAGDCRRKTLRQLTTAVGDGAAAAMAACQYLDRG